MKKETTTKSKLWIWIVAAAVLLLAVGGGVLALVLGGQNVDTPPATDPVATGPRANLYWNIDREFYTANSQTGLSTREADANGQFKMKFAYNGEIVELVIIDKKLVNIIDTQDVVGLQFDENGVVIGQINVRELATEVGKKVYIKKATEDMIIANSSMAMNGMELNLKLGQYSEIYDLREGSETYGQKITPDKLGVMDCMTVYANAEGDNTHFFILSAATRSKIYWRANLWVSSTINRGGLDPDENGVYTLPFYCEGELVQIKTKDVDIVDYYAELGKHNGFTGLIFDDDGYAVDILNAAVGVAGQQTFYALDVEEVNGTHVKLKNNWSTSGVMNWEGDIPAETPIYNVSSWAYSEGVMGQKLSVTDLKVGDRITMFSDMDGNPIEIGLTLRRVDLKPMFNNNSKYDAATRSTTRVKDEDGYWTYTFIDEKGIHKYKTKDEKLATFIDSYPERVFGIVTKGDKLVKAYEYECIYGYTRFSTALYVDSINGTIMSCTDRNKANAYTAVLSEDYKVLDISGDSKQWGQKIKLQVGDVMISFRNTNKEVCMIYVTKRSMGGKLYVNTNPNTSRAPVTEDKEGNPLDESKYYWEFEMTDINGKKVTLTLPVGKKVDDVYANKYLQSRIDGATQGIIALEVSKTTIKDAHAVGNMASGNSVATVIITKAGTEEFEYKTVAKPDDEASIYPGWTGKEGLKKINISADIKSYKGEKLTGSMKVGDVYYMVRNRANETVALFLTNRGIHKDLYFLKESYNASGVSMRPQAEDGFWYVDMMYQGKPVTVKTDSKDIINTLDAKTNGCVLKFKDGKVFAVADYASASDILGNPTNNWDVSKISGNNVTLKINIPTTSTEVGDTVQYNIKGAKVYDISATAGENFGKTTKLKTNDRVRIYTNSKGAVTYVLVVCRDSVKTAYCDHCGKKVTWNPWTKLTGFGQGTAHYYVKDDMNFWTQYGIAAAAPASYEVVLDLNGKTVTKNAGTSTRMFLVNAGKTLTILDSSEAKTGVLQGYGCGEGGQGNIFLITGGSTLNLLSGTLKQIAAEGAVPSAVGGVVYCYDENTVFNMKGGTIIGGETIASGKFTNSYGAVYMLNADFNMSGGLITGGTADRGGNVWLGNKSDFVMTGGEIVGGTARDRGGNVFGNAGSSITVKGGVISGGTVTGKMGGNIYGPKVVIEGGEILNGTAKSSGGNIFIIGTDSTLEVHGGKIAGGTAASGGGNIYSYGGNGVISITGGEIVDGISTNNVGQNIYVGYDSDGKTGSNMSLSGGTVDGGVYIATEGGIKVSKDAKIGSQWTGLQFTAGTKMTIEAPLSAEAKLPITADGVFAVAAGGLDVDIAQYIGNQIVADKPDLCTIVAMTDGDGVKQLVAVNQNPMEVYGHVVEASAAQTFTGATMDAKCEYCGVTVTWTGITQAMVDAALAETSAYVLDTAEHTHYFLAEDILMPAYDNKPTRFSTTSGTNNVVCFHLNGKTLDQNGGSESSNGVLLVGGGTTLNVMGNGTVIGTGVTSSSMYSGGALDVRGSANIFGGTYKSSHADRPAVAVFNVATGEAARDEQLSARVINMFGGTITRGAAADTTKTGSSNVWLNAGAHVFNMYGGTIENGIANRGGNVRVKAGTFNLYGGTITGGQSANLGGNINMAGGTLNVKGGTISNGKCAASGGSIGVVSGTTSISGGTVTGGTAANGGLIYVAGGTLKISGEAVLENGTSSSSGGNICQAAGTLTITGGTIKNGTAGTGGGNISLSVNANIKDATITGGTAATIGDNISFGSKKLTLTGATVDGGIEGTTGSVVVNNGTKVGAAKGGIVLATGQLTLADDLAEGTEIYISSKAGGTEVLSVANDNAKAYLEAGIVKSSNAAIVLTVNEQNELHMANTLEEAFVILEKALAETTPTDGYVEAACPVCGINTKWHVLTDAIETIDADATKTHFYLAENLTREGKRFSTTGSSGSVTCIHLNGKTYDMGAATSNAIGALRVNAGTTMNILDRADNSGVVIGPGYAYPTSSPTMWGGGAIDARGTVNIYGGTFKSSRADRPAVACFGSAGTGPLVNMYDGKIVKGDAITTTDSNYSSNVRMDNSKQTFNMYGGEISGGIAANGGNVRMQNGNFNMYGGVIKDGTAANLGGNICVRGGTFTLYGGEVLNGEVNGNNCSGGSFGLVSGTLSIQGGIVDGGTAVNGGLIYVYGGTLKISGGELKNGTGKGGSVLIGGGTSTITGGTFTGGKIPAASETEQPEARDITVNGGKSLTIGKNLVVDKVYVGGTLTVQNGTVANVELAAAGRIALADGVAAGTKITVVVPATQTIATIENAANYLAYFEAGVDGASIAVKEGTTNEIVMTLPTAEPAPAPAPAPQA